MNAIRNADTSAGINSGNVTRQNVFHGLAPRSCAASSSDVLSRSSNGRIVRIVYGSATTTWPMMTACMPTSMYVPATAINTLSIILNSTSSAIPNTRYGITSGENTSAENAPLPRNTRRTSA